MDKKIIMKIDDETDLLNKEQPIGGVETHPVLFPSHIGIRNKQLSLVNLLKDYKDREFVVTPLNYGLEVSINYADGFFTSMILKGSGIEGERISDAIASKLVPMTAKNKKRITLHAIITIQNLNALKFIHTKREVLAVLKKGLREGFIFHEDCEITCRPLRLYIEGTLSDVDFAWEEINNTIITGLRSEFSYDDMLKNEKAIMSYEKKYHLPQCGVIITDQRPEEPDAFPETHILFN